MTRYDYLMTMKKPSEKTVRVAELKAELSAYLRSARAGNSVVVCDRDTPIARLVPYAEADDGFVVHAPTRPVVALRATRGIKTKRPVDVVALLRDGRDQR